MLKLLSRTRHRPAAVGLRLLHHRPEPHGRHRVVADDRRAWAAGAAPRPARQRPAGDARRPRLPRGAALHPLRRLRQRLPAYQAVGGHVFGHIYTGPIGLILTAVPPRAGDTPPGRRASASLATPARRSARSASRWRARSSTCASASVDAAGSAAHQARPSCGAWPQPPASSTGWPRRTAGCSARSSRGRLRRARCPVNDAGKWRSLPALAARPLRDRLGATCRSTPLSPSHPVLGSLGAAGLRRLLRRLHDRPALPGDGRGGRCGCCGRCGAQVVFPPGAVLLRPAGPQLRRPRRRALAWPGRRSRRWRGRGVD